VLSIFCLAAIGSLLAIRTLRVDLNAVSHRTAPEAIAADFADLAKPPLAKSDRLPISLINSDQQPVTAVKIEKLAPVPASRQTEANEDVVSWHWHEGSKVVRRLSSRGSQVDQPPTRTRRPATPIR